MKRMEKKALFVTLHEENSLKKKYMESVAMESTNPCFQFSIVSVNVASFFFSPKILLVFRNAATRRSCAGSIGSGITR